MRDSTSDPDQILALLDRAFDGDLRSERELTETIILPLLDAAVTRFLLRAPGRRFEKADVVQDVFEHLYADRWSKLRRYDPKIGSFATYVWAITGHWIRDHSRRRLPPCPVIDPEEGLAPESGPDGKLEIGRILDRIEDELDEHDSALFQWIYLDGEHLDIAAARLQLSKEALYKRKQRLEARIRTLISGGSADSPKAQGGDL